MSAETGQEKRSHADEAIDLLSQKVHTNKEYVATLLKRLSAVLPPGGPHEKTLVEEKQPEEPDHANLSPIVSRIKDQSLILGSTNQKLSDILDALQI